LVPIVLTLLQSYCECQTAHPLRPCGVDPQGQHSASTSLHDLLSRGLRGNELTDQAARFVNAQIDELAEQETRLEEQQWALEDQINELQKDSYNAEAIAGQLKEFDLPTA